MLDWREVQNGYAEKQLVDLHEQRALFRGQEEELLAAMLQTTRLVDILQSDVQRLMKRTRRGAKDRPTMKKADAFSTKSGIAVFSASVRFKGQALGANMPGFNARPALLLLLLLQ